ncbi:hypothetical protein BOX15_Mlig011967g2 [Macrostomum lignano]|uniref:Uncharacterized protein n=1 Tax=Macrostomum lignano TaxID=282301 RepID=A0A267E6M3_9PLAT|nr:hypothetical protein BOX15_Mlig011967g2 [Macrostomum lignano]
MASSSLILRILSVRRMAMFGALLLMLMFINFYSRPLKQCNCANHLEGSHSVSSDSQFENSAVKSQIDNLETRKSPDVKSAKKFVNDFKAGYEAFYRYQNKSLYQVQKDTRLPLLRLSEAENDVKYRTKMGKQWMQEKTAVFVGTARNAKDHLPRNIKDIHRLGKLFKDYWIVFVENDSKDGTREFLIGVVKQYNKTIILGCEPINSPAECHIDIKYRSGKIHKPGWAQKRNEEEIVDRGVTMSILRNMILDYIYANLADKADLMIAIEPDISWHPWNLDNIAQGIYYFSTRPQLDLLCANGRLWGKIYDPCSRTYYSMKKFTNVDDNDKTFVTDAMAVEKNKIPIKVDSCFQAFAIYRISSLVKHNAHYYLAPGERNCEHNTLARQLPERYIDPVMWLDIYSLVVHSRDRW